MFEMLNAHESMEVEYARSGRAKCKGCKQIIEKDTLRIGDTVDVDSNIYTTYWYHLPCHKLKPRFKHIQPKKHVRNLQKMTKSEQTAIIKHLQNQVERLNQPKPSKKEKASKSKAKEESSKKEKAAKSVKKVEQPKKEEKSKPKSKPKSAKKVQQPKKEEKSKSKPKAKGAKKEEKAAPKVERRTRMNSKPAQEEVKSEKSAKKSKRSASKSVGVEAKKPEKKKKLKKDKPSAGYSAQQKAEFRRLFNEYMGKSAAEMKEELARNLQTKTGTKDVLAEKCADGKILGQIPLCQNCGGGRPKFDSKTGTYTCRGYMDDADFVNCHSVFSMDEIKRNPWV